MERHIGSKNASSSGSRGPAGTGILSVSLGPLASGKHHNQFKSLEVAQGMMCSAGLLIKTK